MKKSAVIMCVVLAAGSVMVGCSNSSDSTSSTVSESYVQSRTEKAENLNEVFKEIGEQITLPEMIELEEITDLDRFYGISADDVEDFAGGIDNSGVSQDEVVLILAKDETAADNIEELLQKRYNSKLSQQQNYNADEAAKIQKCKVEKNGKYVTLIISDDSEKITEIFKNSI